MSREQWSGAVFALLVVVPAALIPKMGHPERLLDLRYSLWAIVPVVGGFIAGLILRRRLSLALFAAVAGYTGFWSAATWGAGSRATSVYEALSATGVGILPVFLFYALYKRFTKPRHALPADH
jgi:hypothetical protein